MPGIGRSLETEQIGVCLARGWGGAAHGHGVSFRDDVNVVKFIVAMITGL